MEDLITAYRWKRYTLWKGTWNMSANEINASRKELRRMKRHIRELTEALTG